MWNAISPEFELVSISYVDNHYTTGTSLYFTVNWFNIIENLEIVFKII